ncbi:ECF transporter S component [Clostridium sp. Cult1]|uniref:ECF transporter S component n=1 Tax=Clostridium sp. Cult1 TaxID=2079002 RepID=UPI001F361101|nr:ECF transporter S component [Clostridium sp. Cult1]MCF6461820.1 ECF transporter S component [Clostridium sp. Cult1]
MRFRTKDLVTAAVLIAIGIILPMIIHISGINGAVFLPMHIPVLISGLILGSSLGFIVGVISPILNHILTGMPPVPILWIMLVELAVYGLISGYLYRRVKMTLMPSLIFSMIIGRVSAALMVLLLGTFFSLPLPPLGIYIKGITITALPGIIIQILLIPSIVRAYEKNR